MKKIIFLLSFLGLIFNGLTQVSITTDNSAPDPSAMLELKSSTKGFLSPRVALTATNSALPIIQPAIGLQVYNTATAGTAPTNVTPGLYVWNGTRWLPCSTPIGTSVGDMLYWNGGQWINVPAGLPGQFLQMSASNIPVWMGSTYPTVTTTAASAITSTTATSGGNVTSDGGAAVVTKGICWNTAINPTLANSKTVNGSGLGSFSSSMTGLIPNTLYYVRAYATNSAGTGYGPNVTFTTLCSSYLPASVTIVASANPVCQNSSVTFTATPVNGGTAPSYQWVVNGSNAGTNSSNYTYVPLAGDVVQCIMTSNKSCVSGNPATSNSITMSYLTPVNASVRVYVASSDACSNDSVTFGTTLTNVGPNPGYQWSANSVVVNGATNSTFRTLAQNRVDCSVTTNLTCPTVVQSYLEPGGITVETNPVCYGRPIKLGCGFLFYSGCGAGGSTYSWQNSSGSWTSDMFSATINYYEPGYNSDVFYLDVASTSPPNVSRGWACVEVLPHIQLNANTSPVSCHGGSNGSIMLNPSGGIIPYTFQWSNGYTSQNISGLTTGNYTVTVTDGNFCTNIFKEEYCSVPPIVSCDSIFTMDPDNSEYLVGTPPPITTSLTANATTCSNTNNGSVTCSVSGGTPPYTYAWTGPNGFTSTQQNLTNLAAGVYNLTVRDFKLCVKTSAIYVPSPPPITVSGTITPTACSSNTGAITLTVAGVNPPYTFLWNDGVTTQNRSGLTTGTYSVIVTDNIGCSGMSPSTPSFYVYCY